MKISGQFKRLLIEKYIGEDYFRVNKLTKIVLLQDAFKTHERELQKIKWKKWELSNYSSAERIYGRKGKTGIEPNRLNQYTCTICNECFRLKATYAKDMKRHNKKIKLGGLK